MITVDEWCRSAPFPVRLIMQVHDELVLEVREDGLPEARDAVSRLMSEAARLSVPLKVEAGSGSNWDQAH